MVKPQRASVEVGGSFSVVGFELGVPRHSLICISAPVELPFHAKLPLCVALAPELFDLPSNSCFCCYFRCSLSV